MLRGGVGSMNDSVWRYRSLSEKHHLYELKKAKSQTFQVCCWIYGYIIGLFICLFLILTLLRQRDLLCSHFANCVFLFCRCSGRIYYHSSWRGKDQDHARKGIHTETHTQSAAPLLRGACKHCLKVMACRQRAECACIFEFHHQSDPGNRTGRGSTRTALKHTQTSIIWSGLWTVLGRHVCAHG